MVQCCAIDIGAGSGRLILGSFNDGMLSIQEVHRFTNSMEEKDGKLVWNIDNIFKNVCDGLKKVSNLTIDSIGVDTWGVDFVLLDEFGEKLGLPVAYRDSRTKGKMPGFFQLIGKGELYTKTGIQFMEYNTVFQFVAMLDERSAILGKAKTFLMIPDYLNYCLTGKITNEFTNASTTQMINAKYRTWDDEIISALKLKKDLFQNPVMPGSFIGFIKPELSKKTGLKNTQIVAVASHDTGSAVIATPAKGKDWVYISSGTWCLMGIESDHPITDDNAFKYNFTNEGGINGSYRILKNIMGLWIIRGIKNSLDIDFSYEELIDMAERSVPFQHTICVNHSYFTNPQSMCDAISRYCLETGQKSPATPGEYIRCAEEGLGFLYKQVLEELREVCGFPLNRLHILGGGVNDRMMCQFAADATGLETFAGPVEATAIGNLAVQALTLNEFSSIEDAREVVLNSFDIKKYKPTARSSWSEAYKRYLEIREKSACQ